MQPLIAQNGIYKTVFVAVILLFSVQQLPALRSTFGLRGRARGSIRDRGSYTVVQVLVMAGVLFGYEAATRVTGATISWHRPLIFFFGIGIAVIGTAMSWFAVRQLGRYFTVVVAVRSDQPVIQSGLYGVVRHPSYCGQLLVFLGYAVTLTNWASIPAVMVPIVAGYMYRITVEERALREQLGRPYAEYMARSNRLIPRVW